MAQATEVVYIPFKEGSYPDDPASGKAEQFNKLLQTILAQDGAQRLYWGRQKENPGLATLFIDWDTVDHHKRFIAADIYKPFIEEVLSLAGGPPSLHHVHFEPHPPTDALSTDGATEVISVYFPASYSEEDQSAYHANLLKFVDIVKGSSTEVKGTAGGWAEEEVDIPGTEEKGRLYNALISWTSVEAHLEYRNTQTFKDNVHMLRGAKDLKDVKVFHVHPIAVLKQ